MSSLRQRSTTMVCCLTGVAVLPLTSLSTSIRQRSSSSSHTSRTSVGPICILALSFLTLPSTTPSMGCFSRCGFSLSSSHMGRSGLHHSSGQSAWVSSTLTTLWPSFWTFVCMLWCCSTSSWTSESSLRWGVLTGGSSGTGSTGSTTESSSLPWFTRSSSGFLPLHTSTHLAISTFSVLLSTLRLSGGPTTWWSTGTRSTISLCGSRLFRSSSTPTRALPTSPTRYQTLESTARCFS
mmetsp:Transcript_39078/g.91281  ORF Transcript_39078/g.91281 Transcript_39078/m.91281 type:complete len:237 (+) Transcript_39078:866-1576(+)